MYPGFDLDGQIFGRLAAKDARQAGGVSADGPVLGEHARRVGDRGDSAAV
jgi:hypothetical protein